LFAKQGFFMRFRFWKKPKPVEPAKKPAEQAGQERPVVTEAERRKQAQAVREEAKLREEQKKRDRKETAARELAEKARMLDEGAQIPGFAKACIQKGLNPGQTFQNLYQHFSRIRGLSELEAMAEVGSRIEGLDFNEARFWAEIMLVNGLQPVSKAKVPKKYLAFVTRGKKK
jgi:hypothetical protein